MREERVHQLVFACTHAPGIKYAISSLHLPLLSLSTLLYKTGSLTQPGALILVDWLAIELQGLLSGPAAFHPQNWHCEYTLLLMAFTWGLHSCTAQPFTSWSSPQPESSGFKFFIKTTF